MRKYVGLFWGLVFLFGGYHFIKDHFSDDVKRERSEKISHLKQLIENPQKAQAKLDTIVTERTVKILGLPVKTYEANYYFTANYGYYKGLYKSSNPPNKATFEVSYLAEDPTINSIDPKADLAKLEEEQTSDFGLYLGLFFTFIGLISVLSFIQKRRAEKREEEEEFQRALEEDNKRFLNSDNKG